MAIDGRHQVFVLSVRVRVEVRAKRLRLVNGECRVRVDDSVCIEEEVLEGDVVRCYGPGVELDDIFIEVDVPRLKRRESLLVVQCVGDGGVELFANLRLQH